MTEWQAARIIELLEKIVDRLDHPAGHFTDETNKQIAEAQLRGLGISLD